LMFDFGEIGPPLQVGIELAPSQREAVTTALNSKLLVITGGPGTGKTTLLKSVLMILQVPHRFGFCVVRSIQPI
jgi:ATP-dependent exoDNAse (exonuclease V) alpha subunit